MKKVLAVAAIAAGLSLVGAPVASADNQSFLNELKHTHGYHFAGSDIVFVTWGLAICYDESQGINRDQIVRNVLNANSGLDVASGLFFVQVAERNLCSNGR